MSLCRAPSDDPAPLAGRAYKEVHEGKLHQSRELWHRALRIDPALIDAEINLGAMDAKQGTSVTLSASGKMPSLEPRTQRHGHEPGARVL